MLAKTLADEVGPLGIGINGLLQVRALRIRIRASRPAVPRPW